MKTSEITAKFVDLARRHDWSQSKLLPCADVEILFAIISTAGFNPDKVELGFLTGPTHDQRGKSVDRAHPVNSYCAYLVICRNRNNDHLATGWLDQAVQFARGELDREDCIKAILSEIERSIQLKQFI